MSKTGTTDTGKDSGEGAEREPNIMVYFENATMKLKHFAYKLKKLI